MTDIFLDGIQAHYEAAMTTDWINKWDKAPPQDKYVLISFGDSVLIATGVISNDGALSIYFIDDLERIYDATYWMPLPLPAQEI